MRIMRISNNNQTNRQQNFGKILYNGTPTAIKKQIEKIFGGDVLKTLEELEKTQAENDVFSTVIGIVPEKKVIYCTVKAKAADAMVRGFPKITQSPRGALALIDGLKTVLSDLTLSFAREKLVAKPGEFDGTIALNLARKAKTSPWANVLPDTGYENHIPVSFEPETEVVR